MEFCLKEDLPPSVELEEGLRNGVYLGKLAHYFAPDAIPLRKIYDQDMKRYEKRGLHFKHTDNINHFFTAMQKVGLPNVSFSLLVVALSCSEIGCFRFCLLVPYIYGTEYFLRNHA